MARSISSIAKAEAVLQTFIPSVSKYIGDGLSLDRMWPLLDACGNPQDNLKTIHIAGTSGKTSTAYMCAACLHASGQQVGLTVSPHVDSITERIQVNNVPLSEQQFCAYLSRFFAFVDDLSIQPSYFEILICFALWVFVEERVDYAVVETGMGGLLDGTNVIKRADKVCIITDIGYDHQAILGETLREIAAQKAGIIHEHNAVITHQQSKEIMQPIKKRTEKKRAQLITIDKVPETELPEFQNRNWAVAKRACEYVATRDGFKLFDYRPTRLHVPARIEQMMLSDGTLLVMDGAHNQQKMHAFVASFQKLFPGQTADVLLALKEGKDTADTLKELQPITNHCIVTTFKTTQDLPVRSQPVESIGAELDKLGSSHTLIEDNQHAIQKLLQSDNKLKIITGSFYLLGQVRPYLTSSE